MEIGNFLFQRQFIERLGFVRGQTSWMEGVMIIDN